MEYLADSNVIIDYLALRFQPTPLKAVRAILNESLNISAISKIEVLGFNASDASVSTKTESFMELAQCYDLTAAVVDKTIQIRKQHKVKIADAIIAATAIVNGFMLLSRNIKDFNMIEELVVIDPHTLQ